MSKTTFIVNGVDVLEQVKELEDTCETYRKQAVEAMFIIRRIEQMCEGENKVDADLILKEIKNEQL